MSGYKQLTEAQSHKMEALLKAGSTQTATGAEISVMRIQLTSATAKLIAKNDWFRVFLPMLWQRIDYHRQRAESEPNCPQKHTTRHRSAAIQ